MSTSDTVAPQAATRLRIVEQAARLLREGGVAAVTTRAVAQAAGVPAPTLFRLFGDKDGLMDAVAEHVMVLYVAAKSAAGDRASSAHSADVDPVADLRVAWHAHLDFGLANPDLFVLLSTPGRLDRSAATAAGIAVLEAKVGRLAAAGLLAVSESRAVAMIHAAGTGVVLALLQQPVENRDTLLADTMLEAALNAVLAMRTAPPTSDLAPLAIAFGAAVPDLPGFTEAERRLLAEWVSRAIDELT